MDDLIADLYNACNPVEPATAEYYVDASEVRGNTALCQQFQSELVMASRSDNYLCFLFSGHIGCGKSSELQHLRHVLMAPAAKPLTSRYFPVLLDTAEYLDYYDVTPTDILLAIVAELAAVLHEEVGVELKDSYFLKRFNEIKQFFLSEIEMKERELPLSGIKLKLQRLKREPEARQKVRDRLLPQMTSIREEINQVFDEARVKLAQEPSREGKGPFADFVLILDNLEKIQRLTGHKEGEESQKELFVERAPQLKGLKAHMIYTVPLTLVHSHGPQLNAIYGTAPFVLPMIKVTERGNQRPYESGRKLMRKRLRSTPIEQIFNPDALEWLINYSGGHVRELMQFVREACVLSPALPIDLHAAKRSLRRTVALYSTSIPASHWPKLAAVELAPDQKVDTNDPDYRTMLEQLTLLEYVNGGDSDDAFQDPAPWYAVNPIVRELSQFKSALRALQTASQ